MPAIPQWKETVLTILVIWVLVSAVLWVLMPVIAGLPFLVGTLLLTLIVVPVSGYLVMPIVMRAAARWLTPK